MVKEHNNRTPSTTVHAVLAEPKTCKAAWTEEAVNSFSRILGATPMTLAAWLTFCKVLYNVSCARTTVSKRPLSKFAARFSLNSEEVMHDSHSGSIDLTEVVVLSTSLLISWTMALTTLPRNTPTDIAQMRRAAKPSGKR